MTAIKASNSSIARANIPCCSWLWASVIVHFAMCLRIKSSIRRVCSCRATSKRVSFCVRHRPRSFFQNVLLQISSNRTVTGSYLKSCCSIWSYQYALSSSATNNQRRKFAFWSVRCHVTVLIIFLLIVT